MSKPNLFGNENNSKFAGNNQGVPQGKSKRDIMWENKKNKMNGDGNISAVNATFNPNPTVWQKAQFVNNQKPMSAK